jgi:Protein of unknown function (DUF2924)
MPVERSGIMDKQTVDTLIDELPGMARPRMAELWEEYFGHTPATKLRFDLMRPILAYRIQERHRGPLPSDMQRRLQDAMKAYSPQVRASPVGRYKAGIRIIREWGGVIHEVQVTDGRHRSSWVSAKTHISKNLITRMLRLGLISEPKNPRGDDSKSWISRR